MIYPKEFRMDGTLWDVDYIMTGSDSNLKKQFLQRIYNKYVNIRMIVGGNKCRKMTLHEVKSRLRDMEYMQKVQRTLSYTVNDIKLIVFLAENEIPFIK